ncbi:uncharacterized protein PFL1_06271 [Pseudozyma flocculosa PF-1]|uniref:Uncharacterized protein n=2 Tax=Pseudozyma flocculosa TaxID=84751 RepID=A0A5C3F8B7_9BASI|nr:uncharacterized protein PFL1_06271 [Pseudozyma flocculosa PF-1]EPQ26063.1 hypothetical protein PFL1_06271 [Pseudozyma flocculosa PF-1]SPO40306.1 uncharacterized protein PSFLO_05788 [Pseudozyma flocculosa]
MPPRPSHHRSKSVHWATLPSSSSSSSNTSSSSSSATAAASTLQGSMTAGRSVAATLPPRPATSPGQRTTRPRTKSLPLSAFGPPRFFAELEQHMQTAIINPAATLSRRASLQRDPGAMPSRPPTRERARSVSMAAYEGAEQTSAHQADARSNERATTNNDAASLPSPSPHLDGGAPDSDETILGRIQDSFSRASQDECRTELHAEEDEDEDLRQRPTGQDVDADQVAPPSPNTSLDRIDTGLGIATSRDADLDGSQWQCTSMAAQTTGPHTRSSLSEINPHPHTFAADATALASESFGARSNGFRQGELDGESEGDTVSPMSTWTPLDEEGPGDDAWSLPTTPDSDHAVLELAASDVVSGLGKVKLLDLRLSDPDPGERVDVG